MYHACFAVGLPCQVSDLGAFHDSPWQDTVYNDASWPSGPAPLGQRCDPVVTSIGENVWQGSAFFRMTVNVRAGVVCGCVCLGEGGGGQAGAAA